jgi:hypothetical protein
MEVLSNMNSDDTQASDHDDVKINVNKQFNG